MTKFSPLLLSFDEAKILIKENFAISTFGCGYEKFPD